MALTPRENALLLLEHKMPERIVNLIKDSNMLGSFFICEKGPATPEYPMGGTGRDWFGVQWRWEESSNAPMVDPDYPPVMTDITEWREQIVFPDLDAMDFRAAAQADLSSPRYDPDKLNQVCIQSGPFERLMDTMSTEEALCALLEEPEACAEFFSAVADYKIELIDRLAGVYPIDLIDYHDDYGTQISSFMSVDTWRELLMEPLRRVVSHCKAKGIHLQLHSCGCVESLVPSFIEAGLEHWSSCQGMNDIPGLIKRYGRQLTFFGCMDSPEITANAGNDEALYRLVGERIDDICRGGCVMPLGNSTVKGLRPALERVLAEREDFYTKEENRRFA